MESLLLWMLVISGVIFVVQSVLGLMGVTDDMPETDGLFGYLTIRNAVTFILGFSAAGYLGLKAGLPEILSSIAGVAFGFIMSGSVIFMMKGLHRLEQKNELMPADYRGIYATVVIKIPASNGGQGKVEFVLNERVDEMPAITSDEEDIPKGTQVQVAKLMDNGVLLVHKVYAN